MGETTRCEACGMEWNADRCPAESAKWSCSRYRNHDGKHRAYLDGKFLEEW